MLSVKFYRNLRNLFYGIYFNKFHTICKEKFQKVTIELAMHSHSAPIFRLRRKKILHLREELLCGFFLLPSCLKHISYFHNILWLGTDAAASFLPL